MTTMTTRVPRNGGEVLQQMVAATAGPRRAALRDEAVRAWLPLAQHLAHRYSGRGEPDDDLLQTATVGLIKAIDRFDPDRGVEFAGFAIPTILGEIRRHFRDRTWSVRVPRRLQELRMAITEASNALVHTLGRSPTVADIAAHLNTTEEEVLEGLEGARAYSAKSLSTPVTEDGATSLGDMLGEDDHDMELAELRVALGPAMASLDERERTILSLRFFGNMTQSDIADRIGVSQMHVSRLIARALSKLRAELTAG
ncbi:SigB/SigF/SigG family RNA polymerase sigma factor [Actinoplanes sp. NPDC049681]|uniref:SigB/SigF/SigG family RNA polymerase sigma factor n=1 Tax=Actinoplanes sp. NPDC049681 TaxID=3363905 RepID=UPI0037880007